METIVKSQRLKMTPSPPHSPFKCKLPKHLTYDHEFICDECGRKWRWEDTYKVWTSPMSLAPIIITRPELE